MTGREIFRNFGGLIKLFIILSKCLPKAIQRFLLIKSRNCDSRFGFLLRYIVVSSLAEHVGRNVAIFPSVFFEHIENLEIGDNVSIHQMCYIDCEGGIVIGNDVSIAHRTTILSSNHSYKRYDIPIKYQEMVLERTVINDNAWIGCGCVILAGVEIGEGVVIGANSTVSRSIPEKCVAFGSPARVIKKRF